jgi:hypothetical protein
MLHLLTLSDGEYRNDFHREWNERCVKERERTLSMRFSAEYLRAQSQRMNALVKQEEERLRRERRAPQMLGNSHR